MITKIIFKTNIKLESSPIDCAGLLFTPVTASIVSPTDSATLLNVFATAFA